MYFLIFCWCAIYVQCAIILLSWYSVMHYLWVFVIHFLVFCLCKLLALWLVDYFYLGIFWLLWTGSFLLLGFGFRAGNFLALLGFFRNKKQPTFFFVLSV